MEQVNCRVQVSAPVTEEGLAVRVRELRGGSAQAVNNITVDLIKESCHAALKAPLLTMIDNSIVQGIFLEAFKVDRVASFLWEGKK